MLRVAGHTPVHWFAGFSFLVGGVLVFWGFFGCINIFSFSPKFPFCISYLISGKVFCLFCLRICVAYTCVSSNLGRSGLIEA